MHAPCHGVHSSALYLLHVMVIVSKSIFFSRKLIIIAVATHAALTHCIIIMVTVYTNGA